MAHYNKNHCQGCLRGSFTDQWGRTITIGGIHSYEYFIEIKTITAITIYSYPTGAEARRVFNQLKRKR